MKRVRWFAANWPLSMRTIATRMKARAFKGDSFDGFILDRVRDALIGGRYVEKLSFQEKIIDPFGGEQVFDRILYRQVEFRLFPAFPGIEVWDPPRSTGRYMSELVELCNFEVTISPVSVDLPAWLAAFQSSSNTKVMVDSLQLSGLELDEGVTAKILISGDKDVREALSKVTKNKQFTLDKMHLRVSSPKALIPVQLSSTGAVRIDEAFADDYLDLLRDSLPNSARK